MKLQINIKHERFSKNRGSNSMDGFAQHPIHAYMPRSERKIRIVYYYQGISVEVFALSVKLICKESYVSNIALEQTIWGQLKEKWCLPTAKGKNWLCQRLTPDSIFLSYTQRKFSLEVILVFLAYMPASDKTWFHCINRTHFTYDRSSWWLSKETKLGVFQILCEQS